MDFIRHYTPGATPENSLHTRSIIDPDNLLNVDGSPKELEPGEIPKILHNRHIQMIAIGGAIGSGLYIGSGGALAEGGPGNLVFGFMAMGIAIYFTMQALGELAVMYPIKGSLSAYSTRFIHPAWGFSMTWNYVLQWWGTLPLEISAAAITIQYWNANINLSIFVSIFLGFVAIINLGFGTRGYGESEVIFSFIKVSAVFIFVLLAIIVNLGGGPNGHYYGTTTWINPGAFYNGFHGYCAMFVNAAFAYAGTELVGLAACETVNPHITMPKACKQVVWRIIFFYVISLLCVGFIVPYTNPDLLGGSSDVNTSPFVIAADLAGISGFGDFMNFIILISTLSVGNSSVYGASRTVLALCEYGQAPKWLGYTDKSGKPIVSIIIALLFGLIAFVGTDPEQSVTCFDWLLAISGLSALFTWASICYAHIRFRAAWVKQGHTIEEIPFQAQFGVVGSYIGLGLNILALIATFYTALYPAFGYPVPEDDDATLNTYDFFQIYLAAPVVIAFTLGWLFYSRIVYPEKGWGYISLEGMDLLSGLGELPSLEELRKTREEHAAIVWYWRLYDTVFN